MTKRNYPRMITYINNEEHRKKLLNIFLHLFATQNLLHMVSFIYTVKRGYFDRTNVL